MSEVACTNSQEEYEDDFEKDLDWLISEEEGQSEDQGNECENLEAEIDKELGEDENQHRRKQHEKNQKEEESETKQLKADEERWPSPMDLMQHSSDGESPNQSSLSPTVPPPPVLEDQTDEEKKYILEKIQQANRELQDQESPNVTRHKRLHFKDKLVDLVVPPPQFAKDDAFYGADVMEQKDNQDRGKEADTEVSGKLSELKLSTVEDSVGEIASSRKGQGSEEKLEAKEGRVLVEKDGKFHLVSLKEVESLGLLPPIPNSNTSPRPQEATVSPCKSHGLSSSPHSRSSSSFFQQGVDHVCVPRPPVQPRNRPSSASLSQRGSQRRGTKRRVQSAAGSPCQTTYTLSPQQKELLQKIHERKEQMAREAEQKKQEEEEQKRQENELAFKAWLMKKREQLQEERRIHRAQEMERTTPQRDSSNPEEAFRLWLQRKQEQQQRERQLVELKRLEEDSRYRLRSRVECEHAFKLWLKRKWAEKHAEQQAAREHSRRLLLEERRARRMRDLHCTVNELKPFRFAEQGAFHF
ncbi:coiled-coil domain-containing protein 181 [Thalassophryne amazonica]|uniref:coiled-coil domain-containing protein 181 n=1 Tax=Thalassophryne amazonica TaxID=390379 RepID=UPI0014719DA4|nr:coiled-coil domain-containing protein 181 [Thalassophryne amazonica]XP_034035774.1 coiled-coil domain-containing protein 181 [Thalassophryne amazonica]